MRADAKHRPGNAAAAGRSRGGRERPPYNSPQMGAGKRNVGRKGKVPGFACRLPCFVGRAISPAGQHSDGRKVCGTMQALLPREGKGVARCRTPPPPAAAPPLAGEALQATAPQRLPYKGSWHRASDDGGVHCPPCFANILPGRNCRKARGTMQALPAAKNPPTASKGRASIPHS